MPQPPVFHGPPRVLSLNLGLRIPLRMYFLAWPVAPCPLNVDMRVQWFKVIVWCGGIWPLAVKLRCKIFSASPHAHVSMGELHLEGEDVCEADCEGVRRGEILM